MAGLCAVPVNAKLHPRELAYILEHSGARLCFVTSTWRRDGGAARAAPLEARSACRQPGLPALLRRAAKRGADAGRARPTDPAWLFYTSGTTGRPKGAMLTHAQPAAAMTQGYSPTSRRSRRATRILHAAPMSHGSGLYMLPHVRAGAVNVVPESGGFDPDRDLRPVSAWRPRRRCSPRRRWSSAWSTTPARAARASTGLKTHRLRRRADVRGGLQGGARRASAPGCVQIYGQGETPMTITALAGRCTADAIRATTSALASVGVAQTGIEVAIADADDGPCRRARSAKCWCAATTVMAGYWRDPTATRRGAARRLAAHRRRRRARRGRLPHAEGPLART